MTKKFEWERKGDKSSRQSNQIKKSEASLYPNKTTSDK